MLSEWLSWMCTQETQKIDRIVHYRRFCTVEFPLPSLVFLPAGARLVPRRISLSLIIWFWKVFEDLSRSPRCCRWTGFSWLNDTWKVTAFWFVRILSMLWFTECFLYGLLASVTKSPECARTIFATILSSAEPDTISGSSGKLGKADDTLDASRLTLDRSDPSGNFQYRIGIKVQSTYCCRSGMEC